MCECIEHDDGSMHLCVVCADQFREMFSRQGALAEMDEWLQRNAAPKLPAFLITNIRKHCLAFLGMWIEDHGPEGACDVMIWIFAELTALKNNDA